MTLYPNPLSSLRVSRHHIPAYNFIPNTIDKPLLHYHEAFPRATATTSAIESHLTSIGVVEPQWRFTMYSTTHFHSTTHEVLCISHGKAKLCFGGEENPDRVEKVVEKGDVLIIPAGVGHRLLDDMTVNGGFEMVGSYPLGYHWDMCYGKKEEDAKVKNIGNLAWFEKDPIYGDKGPALDV
ncbi:RmlC-like cupin domain-containing protein [Camillea tinctor]|nr:RmlC-like cupin domain-containing protein [Camillea tinctor]